MKLSDTMLFVRCVNSIYEDTTQKPSDIKDTKT